MTGVRRRALVIQAAVSLLIVLLVSLSGNPASAQFIAGRIDCKWDSNVPSYMHESISADEAKGWAIKICTESDNKRQFAQLFAAPHWSVAGVCSVPFIDVDLTKDPSGHLKIDDVAKGQYRRGYNWMEPRMKMLLSQKAPCPSASDPSYVQTDRLTDGVFSGLSALWESLKDSTRDANAKFGRIPQAHKDFDAVRFKRLERYLVIRLWRQS